MGFRSPYALYFYAGSEQIKMVHSFVFDGDMDRDFIRSLGIRFEVSMREAAYNRHVAFATADGGVWAEPVQPLNGRRILTLDGTKVGRGGRCVANAYRPTRGSMPKNLSSSRPLGGVERFPFEPDDGRRFFYP